MKIALTVWENRISPVFDSAHMLLVVDIENKKVTDRRYEPFDPDLPLRLAERLNQLNVEVLICGAISELPSNIIESVDIELVPFIAGSLDDVLEAYAGGRSLVPTFLMPGCGYRRRGQNRKGQGRCQSGQDAGRAGRGGGQGKNRGRCGK